MTQTRTARCACGALAAVCDGEPVRNSICHCGQCKRRTGSAFAWNATYAAEQVTTSGLFSTYARVGESGRWAKFHFCPTCAGNVFYEIEARPGMVSVLAGGFADPAFPEPKVSVYDDLRCPWFGLNTREAIEID